MGMPSFQVQRTIQAPVMVVFDGLCNPVRLPQWLAPDIEVETQGVDAPLLRGAEYGYLMTRFGFTQEVRLRIDEMIPGKRLTYSQTFGLFKQWVHTMKFAEAAVHQTLVTDIVEYELPFGIFGHLLSDLWLKKDLRSILKNRLDRAQQLLSV